MKVDMKQVCYAAVMTLFGTLGVWSADTVIPCAYAGGNPVIRLETTLGDIDVELDTKAAPETARNFVEYVEKGFYDGLIFHRVIPGFVIQGGGFEPGMKERQTRAPIENEADNGLKNDAGTIAMARTSDPHSASSQFFLNLKNNDFLNHSAKTAQGWGYAVFGRVTAGMDVVKAIAAVETGNVGPFADVPQQDVVITRASVVSP